MSWVSDVGGRAKLLFYDEKPNVGFGIRPSPVP